MHHAREPMSLSMNVYLLLKILREYTKKNENILTLLRTRNIYFIPMINVDGYVANNKCYEKFKKIDQCMMRKNRNYFNNSTCSE